MTRHSKNNTANSVFSKAERDKLSAHYGTQRALLGSNSHRLFDACSLCLSRAVTPVTCSKGHLFCKECVMKDLLSQRDALMRKKQEIEALRKEEELAREQVRIKAREMVLSGKRGSLLFGKRKERDDAKAEGPF
jgi:nitric oxide synthase-interacting protein